MSATVLYMSMSVDGFIAGPNETPANALGDGGERLHEWLLSRGAEDDGPAPPRVTKRSGARSSGVVNRQIVDEFMSTGAVVAGRARWSLPTTGMAITTACRSHHQSQHPAHSTISARRMKSRGRRGAAGRR